MFIVIWVHFLYQIFFVDGGKVSLSDSEEHMNLFSYGEDILPA